MWAFTLTVDEARGLVYMPVSSPGSNFYGGDRPGDNLFANSTIAIDIRTGDLAWYFQNIHRELWDYNLPPSPGLLDIERDGEVIPALAQVGKSGWMFILNRVTGEPVHGVEERPVPAGDVPASSTRRPSRFRWRRPRCRGSASVPTTSSPPTTPRPSTRPPAASWDSDATYNDGPYTPSATCRRAPRRRSCSRHRRRRELERHGLRSRARLHLRQLEGPADQRLDDGERAVPLGHRRPGGLRPRGRPAVRSPDLRRRRRASGACPASSRRGPAWSRSRPPRARSRGRCRWASTSCCPEGRQRVGSRNVGGAIVTAGGLVFIGATVDRRFRAFDSRTGEELWSVAFDYNVRRCPSRTRAMTAGSTSRPTSRRRPRASPGATSGWSCSRCRTSRTRLQPIRRPDAGGLAGGSVP